MRVKIAWVEAKSNNYLLFDWCTDTIYLVCLFFVSVTLTDAQLDAISQAMTLSETTDTDIGDSFCGQLQDLNQVLRAGILSDTETDAIMREIQKWPVAFKNVATLMEVMEVLEGGNLLNPGGAGAESVTFTDPDQTNPKPQDSITAAYTAIQKAKL